jgi:hypothetical protein
MPQYIPLQAITDAPPISARMAKLLSLLSIVAVLAMTAVFVWGGSDDTRVVKSPAAGTASGVQQPSGGPTKTLRGHAIQP